MKKIIILGTALFLSQMEIKAWETIDFSLPLDDTAVKADQYISRRPQESERLFKSKAIENEIQRIKKLLKNPKLAWMFENCYPNMYNIIEK